MPHLHNNYQKQTCFLNSHVKQLGLSLVQCVQVLVKSISLCHQQLYNFKKEKHENAQQGSVFIDLGCLCCSPLGPPINLWTTGTVGRWLVLSVRNVTFVSVASLVLLSLWAEMSSSSDKRASVWFQYQFRDVSVSKVSCSYTAKCTLTQFSKHQTRLLTDRDSSVCNAWSVTCYCSDM